MRASLLLLALLSASALAVEDEIPAGFLEYLGAMVEQDGEWVDPLALQTDEESGAATSADTVSSRAHVVRDDDDTVDEVDDVGEVPKAGKEDDSDE